MPPPRPRGARHPRRPAGRISRLLRACSPLTLGRHLLRQLRRLGRLRRLLATATAVQRLRRVQEERDTRVVRHGCAGVLVLVALVLQRWCCWLRRCWLRWCCSAGAAARGRARGRARALAAKARKRLEPEWQWQRRRIWKGGLTRRVVARARISFLPYKLPSRCAASHACSYTYSRMHPQCPTVKQLRAMWRGDGRRTTDDGDDDSRLGSNLKPSRAPRPPRAASI